MTRLTKEELEAIRKRVDAATPGPWSWWDDGTLYSEGEERILGKAVEGDGGIWFDLFDNDAEFIAASREDIPKLLSLVEYQQAEIERLNDVINQLTETTESFLDDKHFYMDELRKANAEIERVKFEKDEYLKRYVWLLEYVGRKKAVEIFRQRLKEEGDTDDNEA